MTACIDTRIAPPPSDHPEKAQTRVNFQPSTWESSSNHRASGPPLRTCSQESRLWSGMIYWTPAGDGSGREACIGLRSSSWLKALKHQWIPRAWPHFLEKHICLGWAQRMQQAFNSFQGQAAWTNRRRAASPRCFLYSMGQISAVTSGDTRLLVRQPPCTPHRWLNLWTATEAAVVSF